MIATTIEQSKRLVAAGVPAWGADMHYSVRKNDFVNGEWVPRLYSLCVGAKEYHDENCIPAWSVGLLCRMCAGVAVELPMDEKDVDFIVDRICQQAKE